MNLPAPERLNLTYGVAVGRLGLDGKAGLVEILVLEVLPSAPWGPDRRGRAQGVGENLKATAPRLPNAACPQGWHTWERPVRAPGLHTGQVPLSRGVASLLLIPLPLGPLLSTVF